MAQNNFSGHDSIIIKPLHNAPSIHSRRKINRSIKKWGKCTKTVQLTPIKIGGKKNRTRRLHRKSTKHKLRQQISEPPLNPETTSTCHPLLCGVYCLLVMTCLISTLFVLLSAIGESYNWFVYDVFVLIGYVLMLFELMPYFRCYIPPLALFICKFLCIILYSMGYSIVKVSIPISISILSIS
eukprot:283643_1